MDDRSLPKIIKGKYSLQKEIGEGAHGTVYNSRDSDKKQFAIKLVNLSTETGDVSQIRLRAGNEAELLSQINDCRIVTVYEYGEQNGYFFIVMEYVNGKTLKQQLPQIAQHWTMEEKLQLCYDIVDAVTVLHKAGIVHRDLKPANIMLTQKRPPQVKIIDLGISRAHDSQQITKTHEALGTPSYMSPEQADGKNKEVDVRADVFALGAIIYEILGGQRAFEGGGFAAGNRVRFFHPTPLSRLAGSSISLGISHVVEKALSKSKHFRHRNASALHGELKRGHSPPLQREVRRVYDRLHPGWVTVAVSAICAATFAIMFVLSINANRPPRDVEADKQQITNNQVDPSDSQVATNRENALEKLSIEYPIERVAINPISNDIMAIVTKVGTIEIRNVASNKSIDSLNHRAAWKAKVAWSPDGKRLGIGGCDHQAYIWTPTGASKPMPLHAEHQQFISNLAWPDDESIASIDRCGHVVVYDIQKDHIEAEFRISDSEHVTSHGRDIFGLPNGDGLIVHGGGWGEYLGRWSFRSDDLQMLNDPTEKQLGISAVALSPNGSRIALAKYSVGKREHCELELWSLEDAPKLLRRENMLPKAGPKGRLKKRTLHWVDETNLLVSTESDTTRLNLANPDQDAILAPLPADVKIAGWSGTAIVGLRQNSLSRYETAPINEDREISWKLSARNETFEPMVSRCRDGFIVSDSQNHVHLFDGTNVTSSATTFQISAFATHPSSSLVALGSKDGHIEIRNGIKGEQVVKTSIDSEITQMVFSPDANELAIGTAAGLIALINVNAPDVPKIRSIPDLADGHPINALIWPEQHMILCGRNVRDRHGLINRIHPETLQVSPYDQNSSLGPSIVSSRATRFEWISSGNFMIPSQYGCVTLCRESDRPHVIRTSCQYSMMDCMAIGEKQALLYSDRGAITLLDVEPREQTLLVEPDGIPVKDAVVDRKHNQVFTIDQLGRIATFTLDDITRKPVLHETKMPGASFLSKTEGGLLFVATSYGQVAFLSAQDFTIVQQWTLVSDGLTRTVEQHARLDDR